MRAGKSAPQALRALLEADEHPEWRQVAMIDAQGRVAVHTGSKCIPEAGHIVGAQFSVQANLMAGKEVWPAMAEAYANARGDLADRMLAALEAAQEAGGDIRGRQSAAILIVKPRSTGRPYLDKVMDLRVEDHPEPVKELRRLVRLHRAYELMNEGDEYIASDEVEKAMRAYGAAMKLAPEVTEIKFWTALTMFTAGHEKEALPIFRDVFRRERRWAKLVPRLPAAGLLPDDPHVIGRILRAAKR